MAATVTFQTSAFGSIPGGGTSSYTASGEAILNATPDIPKGYSGSLTTRTNNTSGTVTLATGHGLTTGNRCDLYWTNADGTEGKAFGAVLGTVSAAPADTAVPIASTISGSDNLPPADTTIIVSKCVEVPLAFEGDDMNAVVAQAPQARSCFVFNDGTYNLNPQHVSVGAMYYWHDGLADTNPLEGESLTRVFISTADTDRTISNSVVSVITEG